MFTKARYLLCFQHLLEIEDMFNEDIYKVYPVASIHIYIYIHTYIRMLHTLPTFWKFFSQQKKMVANVFFANFHPQRASPSDPAPSNSSICLVSLKTSGSWSKTMKLKALPKNQRFWWFFLWEHNRKCIRWTMASAIYFHTRVYMQYRYNMSYKCARI